jgi:hypothetical protein
MHTREMRIMKRALLSEFYESHRRMYENSFQVNLKLNLAKQNFSSSLT